MKKTLKQVLGIDVAHKELVVTMGRTFEDHSIDLYAYKVFKNSGHGIRSLVEWTKKLSEAHIPVRFVMEATGVYHQKLAYHLDSHGYEVSIVMPNKISNYIRTLETNTITDKSCSQAIARFGLERRLALWHRPNDVYRKLQQLVRERDQIVQERTIVKNQLHAEKTEAVPHNRSVKRMEARIKFLNSQEAQVKSDISKIIKDTAELQPVINRICTIPGVGELTAVTVLAETNGFEHIRNKAQLTGYAGLDVKEKQSGTSVKGKPRISKKGNRTLRKSMHLPSLSLVKHDENFRSIYSRLVSKHGIKMKALVAVQRKLLELIYILYKNETNYDEDYRQKNSEQIHLVQTRYAG